MTAGLNTASILFHSWMKLQVWKCEKMIWSYQLLSLFRHPACQNTLRQFLTKKKKSLLPSPLLANSIVQKKKQLAASHFLAFCWSKIKLGCWRVYELSVSCCLYQAKDHREVNWAHSITLLYNGYSCTNYTQMLKECWFFHFNFRIYSQFLRLQ